MERNLSFKGRQQSQPRFGLGDKVRTKSGLVGEIIGSSEYRTGWEHRIRVPGHSKTLYRQEKELAPASAWKAARDNFGEEGRRWMIHYHSGKPLEEITIEDYEFQDLPGETAHFEIVSHDFVSGDIETEDSAQSL